MRLASYINVNKHDSRVVLLFTVLIPLKYHTYMAVSSINMCRQFKNNLLYLNICIVVITIELHFLAHLSICI